MNFAEKRLKELLRYLKKSGSVLVAFSGGVDSTFLLKCAKESLGKENVLAGIAVSATYPEREFKEAVGFCDDEGIRYVVLKTGEIMNKKFNSNPVNRCYFCKKELFSKLGILRRKMGLGAVLDGSNYDDRLDTRYGTKARKEMGVISPLEDLKFGKDEIRALSRKMKLKTSDKPSFACLASRIKKGNKITPERLSMIERAEDYLRDMGFSQVRVRDHGDIARIELDSKEICRIAGRKSAGKVAAHLKKLGFKYVSLDLEGYKMGSMN